MKGGHGSLLQREETHGDAQFADARLFAGVQHGGHLLKLALGVAAHQHAQVRAGGRGRRPAWRSSCVQA